MQMVFHDVLKGGYVIDQSGQKVDDPIRSGCRKKDLRGFGWVGDANHSSAEK